ncbi:hypothetical protein ONE63_000824 [Megalurothrips usitatus]|uniref:UDP-glucuronosyltransferase n=1 Tax=Megalurothrips usitatus TaxID=439358 RepID=A0AAV7Y278_9NEOP|nr:hypothetical protein ONE63_000824 [Megalurothrips usitatus]
MAASLLVLLAVGAAVAPAADAYRVLGMFPFNGRSHNIMFKATMEALADRGHQVVQFSPFPQKKPRANYTDVDLSGQFPSLVNTLTFEQMTSFERFHIVELISSFSGPELCRAVFASQDFRDVMDGKYGKFDVVFTEIFGSDCWTVVAHKLQVPLISIATTPDFAWMHGRVGSPDNPAYLVVNNEPVAGRLTFPQRVVNVFMYILNNLKFKYYIEWPSDTVVREFFGADTPSLSELTSRTSLILVNNHVSLNPARPVPPNVVHVGGIHLKDLRVDRTGAGLEPGLRAWMDGAEHGVIFFTMGSLVRTSSLPSATIQGLIRAFAAVPQRVLWKYESDDIAPLLSDNVRTASWMPQTDILAHPKTVLFITHGGLMGTTEAVVLGVPMLGIPLFADQFPNVALYQSLGIAESVDHRDITEATVLAAIKKLTATDEYRVRAQQIAARFVDRPQSAAEAAVWWTEYVVRHRGAKHLRPIGADLPLYQYLLLDVVAVALAAAAAALLLLRALLRALLPLPSSTSPSSTQKKSKTQ